VNGSFCFNFLFFFVAINQFIVLIFVCKESPLFCIATRNSISLGGLVASGFFFRFFNQNFLDKSVSPFILFFLQAFLSIHPSLPALSLKISGPGSARLPG